MDFVYKVLLWYVWDSRMLVDYLYIIYKLLDKYWKKVYNYVDLIKKVDTKLGELMVYFKEENYSKKNIYELLLHVIWKTWYNVFEIDIGQWLDEKDLPLKNWEKVVKKSLEPGLMIKTADWKIYKRFVIDDVKKLLNLN